VASTGNLLVQLSACRRPAFAPRPDTFFSEGTLGRIFSLEGNVKRTVALGILYSRSGSYARTSDACRTGAVNAIARINADPAGSIAFSAIECDPGGNVDLYAPLCEQILRDTPVRHIIGCVTSWSRWGIIPTLQKFGGTLWYALPYEEFEASDHVVYLDACPNQNLLPLMEWTFPIYGRRGQTHAIAGESGSRPCGAVAQGSTGPRHWRR
jgi:ABC-type branched-subunit amino acid transport system substrate-binding protein